MSKKNNNSFQIALSGIACALCVIFLSLGILSGWLLATGYCVGVLSLMLPLSKKFYRGSFLAYVGAVILSLIFGVAAKFWDIIPFIAFFGLHPIVNALQKDFAQKRNKKWLWWIIGFIVKAVWFDATLILGYYLVYDGVLGGSIFSQSVYDIVNQYIILFAFTLGSVVFAVYDFLVFKCQTAVNYFVYKVKR